MAASVKEIYQALDQLMPFETQASWDNAGLLAGTPPAQVERVLVTLDVTVGAIDEAVRRDCQLIISHHPILFHARKTLREDDPEGATLCRLVRANVALIAVHTNFDVALGGVNDALMQALGLENPQILDEGLRIADYRGTLASLHDLAAARLQTVVRRYGPPDREIRRVAVAGGAGGSLWRIAKDAGADAFLTGEIKHSDALDATAWDLILLEAGHYATEQPSIKVLKTTLQNALDAVQYNVTVFESEASPYGMGERNQF